MNFDKNEKIKKMYFTRAGGWTAQVRPALELQRSAEVEAALVEADAKRAHAAEEAKRRRAPVAFGGRTDKLPPMANTEGQSADVWESPEEEAARLEREKINPILVSNALCAFALKYAMFRMIKDLDGLTINVAGVVKDCLLIGLSFVMFHSPVTPLQMFGYAVALAAVFKYNLDKHGIENPFVSCVNPSTIKINSTRVSTSYIDLSIF